MAELHQVVTRMVFVNYNVEKYHDDHVQSIVSALRFMKYKEPEKTGTGQDNKWIGFDPLPSSFLFMACEGFLNDRISFCKHRVSLNRNEVRSSFGLFSYLEGDHPLKYKPLHMLDYVQFFLDNHRNVGVGYSVKEYRGI
ncbi:2-oxoglutarate-dependent dioxygenase AOP1 [Pyrus ussuriensis x Pyrus communis]|uniref:2-oxoglutarate-dependent dioxygenase AOP1 n=1 Tax=Pyrus ussuriensis x Pyrus communis TaxID=2448454 RepID=A0A5N5I9M3_9ROSA|nr:2-oxoglutarate-dependent dioxygenase AOP1 [Pyrus ussuriensis x Pyrus communis]